MAGNLCFNHGRQQYGWRSLIVQSKVLFKPDKLHPRVVLERAHCDRTTPEPTGHVRQQVVLRKTNCLKVSEGFHYLRKGLKLLEKRFIGPSRRDRDLVSRNRPQGSSQCLSPAPWPAILSGFLLIGGPPFFGKSIFLEILTSAASIIQEVQLLHWASDINNSWIQV